MNFIFCFFIILSTNFEARADMQGLYGFGSSTAALAGANRARSLDAYAVATNPALMSKKDGIQLTLGYLGSVDQFDKIENVVVDNTTLGAGSVQTGKFNTDVPDVANYLIGAIFPVVHNKYRWRLGFIFQVPFDKIIENKTDDYYRPQFALYQTDAQRVNWSVGGSMAFDKLSIGLTGTLYFKTNTNLVSRMPTGAGQSASANTAITIRPAIAPTVSLNYELGEGNDLSLFYTAAKDYRADFVVEAAIGLFTNPSPLNFNGNASLFYDPEVFSIGHAYRYSRWDFLTSVDYEKWSPYDGSMIKLDFTTFTSSLSQIRTNTKFKDIVVPRVGVTYDLENGQSLRLGYAFRPSPVPDQKGDSNFLDSDRHIIGLGHSFKFGSLFGLVDGNFSFDSHLQAQRFVSKKVDKTGPSTTIGFPGYTIAGTVFSYGFALGTDF